LNRRLIFVDDGNAGMKAVASVGNQPYNRACCGAAGTSHGLDASDQNVA